MLTGVQYLIGQRKRIEGLDDRCQLDELGTCPYDMQNNGYSLRDFVSG
jgi:hypothetical protein